MEQLAEKNMGNAVQLMSESDRTEFNRLLDLMIHPIQPFTPNTF
ncbi:hypothetical protein ACIBO6_24430 [Streptomyces luteogriseus]